jgi:hypothetical protein
LNGTPEHSDTRRVEVLTRIVCLALVVGICCSLPLWITARTYPLSPVFDWWPSIGEPFDLIIVLSVCLAALVRVVTGKVHWLLIAVLAGCAVLALGDQNRWQPWFYQYIAMLLILAISGKTAPVEAMDSCRLIVVFTYFWSGIQKLNDAFCTSVLPWMLKCPAQDQYSLGVACACLEAALGLSLLFVRSRRFSAVCLMLMHFRLLKTLGQKGWNAVVLPWNISMLILLVLLFMMPNNRSAASILCPGKSLCKIMALVLFCALPGLNFVGLWDAFLSCALYSGNTIRGSLVFSAEQYRNLPEKVRSLASCKDGTYELDLLRWTESEFNASPNPEVRVYRQTAKAVLNETGGDFIQLKLKRRARFFEYHEPLVTVERISK